MLESAERTIFFLIKIRKGIEDLGYLTEFIVHYLSNIELTITERMTEFSSTYENLVFETLGISIGSGVIGGIIGWGIVRLAIVDAVGGSVAGPIGFAAGIIFGVGTVLVKSIGYYSQNKQILKERSDEIFLSLSNFNILINEKMKKLFEQNNCEVHNRIGKMLAYIEYSLKQLLLNR